MTITVVVDGASQIMEEEHDIRYLGTGRVHNLQAVDLEVFALVVFALPLIRNVAKRPGSEVDTHCVVQMHAIHPSRGMSLLDGRRLYPQHFLARNNYLQSYTMAKKFYHPVVASLLEHSPPDNLEAFVICSSPKSRCSLDILQLSRSCH